MNRGDIMKHDPFDDFCEYTSCIVPLFVIVPIVLVVLVILFSSLKNNPLPVLLCLAAFIIFCVYRYGSK